VFDVGHAKAVAEIDDLLEAREDELAEVATL